MTRPGWDCLGLWMLLHCREGLFDFGDGDLLIGEVLAHDPSLDGAVVGGP